MEIKVIGIPKCGCQFLGSVLGIHVTHVNQTKDYGKDTKIIFVKRNPFDFYGSLYNFLRNNPTHVSNEMRKSAKKLSFKDFFYGIMEKDTKKVLFPGQYDSAYISDKSGGGY